MAVRTLREATLSDFGCHDLKGDGVLPITFVIRSILFLRILAFCKPIFETDVCQFSLREGGGGGGALAQQRDPLYPHVDPDSNAEEKIEKLVPRISGGAHEVRDSASMPL